MDCHKQIKKFTIANQSSFCCIILITQSVKRFALRVVGSEQIFVYFCSLQVVVPDLAICVCELNVCKRIHGTGKIVGVGRRK